MRNMLLMADVMRSHLSEHLSSRAQHFN